MWPQQREIRSRGESDRSPMHDVCVVHVAVGEHDLVDTLVSADGCELVLVTDRNALRVEGAGERGRLVPLRDTGDLGRSEGNDLTGRIGAPHDVEIVKVATCRPHGDDAPSSCSLGHVDTRSDRDRLAPFSAIGPAPWRLGCAAPRGDRRQRVARSPRSSRSARPRVYWRRSSPRSSRTPISRCHRGTPRMRR